MEAIPSIKGGHRSVPEAWVDEKEPAQSEVASAVLRDEASELRGRAASPEDRSRPSVRPVALRPPWSVKNWFGRLGMLTGVRPTNPNPQRFVIDPELLRDRLDHLPLRRIFMLTVTRHPDRTLTHLDRIPAVMLPLLWHLLVLSGQRAVTIPGALQFCVLCVLGVLRSRRQYNHRRQRCRQR